jgi:pimeloyl-ACP methyl ester carboxylesterase
MLDHARTLVQALEVLGLQQVSLVGQDSGGTTARLMALQSPERVDALVLANTEIPHDRSFLIRTLMALGATPFTAAGIRLLLCVGWLRRHRQLGFGSSFANPAMVDGEFFTLAVRPLLDDSDALGRAATFLRNFDMSIVDALAEQHAEIRCPTRLIWGPDDQTFPLTKARTMMDQFTAPIDLVTVPTGRLFAHEEFPEQFAALAAEHLESVRRAAPKVDGRSASRRAPHQR